VLVRAVLAIDHHARLLEISVFGSGAQNFQESMIPVDWNLRLLNG